MIRIIIPTNPRSKKNSQEIVFNKKTGKRMVIQNKKYTDFERECKKYIPVLREPPIAYKVNLKCKFYVCDARRRDIANYLEAIQDILVKYGLLADDNYNIIASIDGCSMEIDRENPRVEIEIKKLDENI